MWIYSCILTVDTGIVTCILLYYNSKCTLLFDVVDSMPRAATSELSILTNVVQSHITTLITLMLGAACLVVASGEWILAISAIW